MDYQNRKQSKLIKNYSAYTRSTQYSPSYSRRESNPPDTQRTTLAVMKLTKSTIHNAPWRDGQNLVIMRGKANVSFNN